MAWPCTSMISRIFCGSLSLVLLASSGCDKKAEDQHGRAENAGAEVDQTSSVDKDIPPPPPTILSFDAAYGPAGATSDEPADVGESLADADAGVSDVPVAEETVAGAVSADVTKEQVRKHVAAQTKKIQKSKKKVAKIVNHAAEIKQILEDKKAEMKGRDYKRWKAERRQLLLKLEQQQKVQMPKLPPKPEHPPKPPKP